MHARVTPAVVPPMWAIPGFLFLIGFFHLAAPGAFVLMRPIGREVNPPHLDGVAVAVVNVGGFLGAALTQGPIGAVLDARWAGTLVDGARRYPVEAYRDGFGVCAGTRFESAGEGRAVARLDFKPELTQLTGLFHAGAIIALADETATAAATGEIDPSGEFRPELRPPTLQMSADLIRNTDQGTLVAEAEIVHRGRTTMPAERPGP